MKKRVGLIKRIFTLLLVVLMSINSFAAIVSDNDGSAFITKAEFDALKSSFQSQIDSYNQSIDSKIDGAIASYLSGMRLATNANKALAYSQTLYKTLDETNFPISYDTINYKCDLHAANYQSPTTSYYMSWHLHATAQQSGKAGYGYVAKYYQLNTASDRAYVLEGYASSFKDNFIGTNTGYGVSGRIQAIIDRWKFAQLVYGGNTDYKKSTGNTSGKTFENVNLNVGMWMREKGSNANNELSFTYTWPEEYALGDNIHQQDNSIEPNTNLVMPNKVGNYGFLLSNIYWNGRRVDAKYLDIADIPSAGITFDGWGFSNKWIYDQTNWWRHQKEVAADGTITYSPGYDASSAQGWANKEEMAAEYPYLYTPAGLNDSNWNNTSIDKGIWDSHVYFTKSKSWKSSSSEPILTGVYDQNFMNWMKANYPAYIWTITMSTKERTPGDYYFVERGLVLTDIDKKGTLKFSVKNPGTKKVAFFVYDKPTATKTAGIQTDKSNTSLGNAVIINAGETVTINAPFEDKGYAFFRFGAYTGSNWSGFAFDDGGQIEIPGTDMVLTYED